MPDEEPPRPLRRKLDNGVACALDETGQPSPRRAGEVTIASLSHSLNVEPPIRFSHSLRQLRLPRSTGCGGCLPKNCPLRLESLVSKGSTLRLDIFSGD